MAMEYQHEPYTIMITVAGFDTDCVTRDMILQVLRLHAHVHSAHIQKLYTLGNIRVWYLKLTDFAKSKFYHYLDGSQFRFSAANILFTFKHLDYYSCASLYWVPEFFNRTNVLEIVGAIAKPLTSMLVHKEQHGKWNIRFVAVNMYQIPHYINVKYLTQYHVILVVLPGRESICYKCGQTGHAAGKCPNVSLHDESNRKAIYFPEITLFSGACGHCRATNPMRNLQLAGAAQTLNRGAVQTPNIGAVQSLNRGAMHTANRGAVLTPNIGAMQMLNMGAVQTPNRGAVLTPNIGAMQMLNMGAVQTPNRGAVLTPNRGAAQTMNIGAVQSLDMEEVQAFNMGPAQTFTREELQAFNMGPAQTFTREELQALNMGPAQTFTREEVQALNMGPAQTFTREEVQALKRRAVQTSNKGAEQSTNRGSEQPSKSSAKQTSKKSAKQSSNKQAEKSKKGSEKSSDRWAELALNKWAAQTLNNSSLQSSDGCAEQTHTMCAKQSFNMSAEQSLNRGIEQSSKVWTDEDIDSLFVIPSTWKLSQEAKWHIGKLERDFQNLQASCLNNAEDPDLQLKDIPMQQDSFDISQNTSASQHENTIQIHSFQTLKTPEIGRNLGVKDTGFNSLSMDAFIRQLSPELDLAIKLSQETEGNTLPSDKKAQDINNPGVTQSSTAPVKNPQQFISLSDISIPDIEMDDTGYTFDIKASYDYTDKQQPQIEKSVQVPCKDLEEKPQEPDQSNQGKAETLTHSKKGKKGEKKTRTPRDKRKAPANEFEPNLEMPVLPKYKKQLTAEKYFKKFRPWKKNGQKSSGNPKRDSSGNSGL